MKKPFGFPKPEPLAISRHKRKVARESFEADQKAKVRRRDGAATSWRGCRWPLDDCPYCSQKMKLRKEVAHINDKGMGGDHGLRSSADQMMLFCHLIHQGPDSIHSGDREVRMRTKAGTDGPCDFYHHGKCVGREVRPGVLRTG